jgi:hypothetical protein
MSQVKPRLSLHTLDGKDKPVGAIGGGGQDGYLHYENTRNILKTGNKWHSFVLAVMRRSRSMN